MAQETLSLRLQFAVTFLFGHDRQVYLSVQAIYENEKIPMDLSSLSMFLFKNERTLVTSDADFCYSLGKFLKKVNINNRLVLAIPHEDDIALFFKRAFDKKIQLFWQEDPESGDPEAIVFSDKLPYTVTLSQRGQTLVCSLENPSKEEQETDWMTFYCDDIAVTFARGVITLNPSRLLDDFISSLQSKGQVIYKDDDIQTFLSTIYTPLKASLTWKVHADLSHFIPQTAKPIPLLTLNYDDMVLQPTLSFQYGEQIIPPTFADSVVLCRISGKKYQRNSESELRFQDQLMGLFTQKDLPFLLQSPADIARFMTEVVPLLVEKQWMVISTVPEFNVQKESVELNFKIRESGQNWFEFEPSCEINGEAYSLQEIARLMVQNQGYVKTKSGFVKIAIDSQKELEILNKMGAFKVGSRYAKADIVPLISMARAQGGSPEAQSFVDSIKNFNRDCFCDVSSDFNGSLRDYQQYGVNWLNFIHKMGCGGILADDMGLGKTIQTIAFCTQLKEKEPILIIGPTNVTYNWKKEIETFSPDKTVVVYTGANRRQNLEKCPKPNFILTTFGIVKNDLEFFESQTFQAVFIDEAQYIKNPKAQVSQAVKSLNSRYRVALTGTPIENHLSDLWNLFDFVMPDFLGNQTRFDLYLREGGKEILKQKIKPFVLRREKREVLSSLPEKTEILLKCTLTDEQRALYRTVLEAAKRGIRNSTGQTERLNVLTALLKLRQVCLDPSLLSEFEGQDLPSAKFELAKEKISELIDEGHKIVLFSQFTKMLDKIETWANSESIALERIDGSVSSKARLEAVDRFQTSDKPGLFVISLKAGGVGLNLTAADYVIHLDPWWNPAVEAQATDRVHRMGQQNKVFVYKLITEDTVEEKIQLLQEEKRQLLGEIIDIDTLQEKKIDISELKALLFE